MCRAYCKSLGLPYRVLRLCGGDMGFGSALTYDMETWSAAQQRWLEVSSVSNFETFQSNRLKLRFRNAEGKTQLAHTLNGSALALPRIVATLLENNQTEDGIKIPEALVPYTKFEWMQIANFMSEFLVTGFADENGDIVLTAVDKVVPNGSKLV
jgi:seryl-tRNA synthetase